MHITDFNGDEDILAFGLDKNNGTLPDIEIGLSPDGTSTDIQIGGQLIRLDGVTDFDPADIRVAIPKQMVSR